MSWFTAKHVLTVASLIFLALAAFQLLVDQGRIASLAKARLIVGSLFGAVSLWLWLH